MLAEKDLAEKDLAEKDAVIQQLKAEKAAMENKVSKFLGSVSMTPGLLISYCWAHIRRDFHKVEVAGQGLGPFLPWDLEDKGLGPFLPWDLEDKGLGPFLPWDLEAGELRGGKP